MIKRYIQNFFRQLSILVICSLLVSCATKKILEYERVKELNINKEFDELIQVKEITVKKKDSEKEDLITKLPPKEKLQKEKVGEANSKFSKSKEVQRERGLSKKKKLQKDVEAVEKKSQVDEQKKKDHLFKVSKSKEIHGKRMNKESKNRQSYKKDKEDQVSIGKTSEGFIREPKLEDTEGFIGRRPQKDPFRVGEKVIFSMNYFNMSAGLMTIEVLPLVEVNGRKSYHFSVSVKSGKVFSYFYSVNDSGETFLDYETMKPSSYSIHVKESKQLKEIRSAFDWEKMEGLYWEKKVTEQDGEQNKKKVWKIEDYSQNVVSALFYLRTFQLKLDKKLAFRVADDGDNMLFTGKVVRYEDLETDLGKFKTVVVKPKMEINGVFKQMGDIFIWLTDDDRKLPVRIEAKIKIGTLIAKLKELHRE